MNDHSDEQAPSPPMAQKKTMVLSKHGHERLDPYYWLRERDNPQVTDYLKAENEYTHQMLAPVVQFEDQLFEEIIERIKPEDMSVPYLHRGYYYSTQFKSGDEHPLYIRQKGDLQAAQEVMLDANQLAEPHDFYEIGSRSVSPDQSLLAFGEDTLSRRIYTIRFKHLFEGSMLVDELHNTTGHAVWAADNKTVFYTRKDEKLRPAKIYRHVLGTDQSADIEVYEEKDETFYAFVYKSKSGKYLMIGSFATLSTEFRYLHADDPNGSWKVFQPRQPKHEYYLADANSRFLIRTNKDAENFRLMETLIPDTGITNWKEVVPHNPAVLIDDVEAFSQFIVLSLREDGSTKIRVMPDQGDAHDIDFDESPYTVYTTSNHQLDTPIVRLSFTSLRTPATTYDYDMRSRELILLKQQPVLGGFDRKHYVTERLMAPAQDGSMIPISIVYRYGFVKDGTQPLLIYGYGSYGHSIDPTFRSSRLSLLDRGFAFAIAHIRGGEEKGRSWYEDGKFLKKKNTFTDFIDCSKFLIQEGYTSPAHLYAMGGSAGGLLIGAVINMAPQLFKGVIAAVPFVDVVTTMLDESIPLTTGEYDEWGNPNEEEYYHYMKSYSPYDNVEAKAYPAMLVTTGLHDSQVQYWEPAKWVARLRDLKTDQHMLLLHTNLETGHSGASGRYKQHRETALQYTFLLLLEGKTN